MNWYFDPLKPLSFDVVMIDIAWRFETWSEEGKKQKSPEVHYDTMGMDEARSLPVASLCRGDAVLWAWGTHPMIDQQIQCVRDWGFNFVTTGVWVKRTKNGKLGFGTGYRLRSASEPFIIATLGSPETCKSVRTVIEGPLREHSRKPDIAYSEAERLVPWALRRADIFSRQTRPGWENFGWEKDRFDEATPKPRRRAGLPGPVAPISPPDTALFGALPEQRREQGRLILPA